jgi:hypothetical protein
MSPGPNPNQVAPRAGQLALQAALVWQPADGEARRYPVCDGVRRRDGGLFLAGPFFLEVGEEVALEFQLSDGPVRARARVTEVVRGEQPGMLVALIDADEPTAGRIRAAAGD